MIQLNNLTKSFGGRIQGFKEQFRYDKVKLQMEDMLSSKEAMPGKLPHKREE